MQYYIDTIFCRWFVYTSPLLSFGYQTITFISYGITIFPQNLTMASFYFKVPFSMATIGQHLQGSTRTCVHSFYLYSCIIFIFVYNTCMHTCILLSTLYHVARFQGQHLLGWIGRNMRQLTLLGRRDFKVQRNFEKIGRGVAEPPFRWLANSLTVCSMWIKDIS